MKLLRVFLKFLIVVLTLVSFFITNTIICVVLFPFKFLRRKVITKFSSFYSKIILKSLGFHLHLEGPHPKNGVMIVGNHMSYLDILIYLSFFESVFVTSVDMKHRPFLGQITLLGGCLYVERRNPKNLPQELKTLKPYFEKGISVCVFPEGTSSNGESVLPFKKSLFQLPLETQSTIQPIVLKYESIDGKAFSNENCDLVCWYGELSFFPHLLKLLSLKKITAKLTTLKELHPRDFESRKQLADHSHRVILEHYHSN